VNPHQCRIALRPRGTLEVLDLAVILVRARHGPLARMLLVTVLPVWVVCVALCVLTDGHWAVLAVPLLVGPVLQAPFTVLAGRLLFAEQITVREVVGDLWGRAPALVASWVLKIGALAASSLTCFYAWPLLQAALMYTSEAALLERVGTGRGLRRTLRLAGGHPGAALVGAGAWYAFVAWFAVVAEVGGQQLVGFVLQLGHPFGQLVEGQVTPYLVLGLLLAQPAYAVVRLLLYVDVRTRVEGWDLQVSLRALGLAA